MRIGSGTYSKPPFTGNCRYSCNSTECVSAVSFRCTTRRRRSPDGAESVGKPAVHNLIFVRISPAWLQKIKTAKLIPAKCMYDKTTQMPLIVPDKQMDDFIALTEGKFEDVLLIDPSTEKLERGDMVRITSGMFAGDRGRIHPLPAPRTGSSSGSKASRPSRRPKCPRPTSRKYLLKHIRSGRPFRPRGWFYLQLSVKTRHII